MATNSDLKKFAQSARRQLREQVAGRLEQVLGVDSVEVREKKSAVDQLKKQIAEHGKAEVIDKVAYTWFNRFCALRYMDANLYNLVRVVSPAPGNVQPELLQEAKAAYLPDEWKKFVDAEKVLGLLNGSIRAENSQQEAYRRLLVGVCNAYSRIMPFMFEAIEDYTELLMPQDLLSENSVLTQTRLAMSDEACQDVEVIGWLYQYYISERKDEVFELVKNGTKIEAEDIPAVTQLFTPHWIVRYLVENSLGRLWLLNHPDSKLIKQMDYYIKPVDEEIDYLKVSSPEELKICDPACGSGHMLTYAFDLLYAIYEEQGYDPIKISSLILENNLYGIEIDERAGALAAFALAMKARGKDKRFFNRGMLPNVCVLENVSFSDQELKEYTHAVGRDLFTEPLPQTLKQFEQAKTFGSLIQPVLTNPAYISQSLAEKNLAGNIFLFGIHERVLKVLKQCEYLSPRYHVVVANPPYMGDNGMNVEIKDFLKDQYPDAKSDTFAAFIVRNIELCKPKGQLGFMSPFVWMFLASHEELRKLLIENNTITSLIQLEYSGFEGATVPICTFTLENSYMQNFRGSYIRLSDFRGASNQSPKTLEAINNPNCGWFYRASASDFKKIPGMPIVYYFTKKILSLFDGCLFNEIPIYTGMATSDNDRFLRYWFEISISRINFQATSIDDTKIGGAKWFPYNKGGGARKWYGNFDYVVNFANNGEEIKSEVNRKYPYLNGNVGFYIRYQDHYFKEGLTWSAVSSGTFTVRKHSKNSIFSNAGFVAIPNNNLDYYIALLNSNVSLMIISSLAPTLNFNASDIAKMPLVSSIMMANSQERIEPLAQECINIARVDWDSNEMSWNFTVPQLLRLEQSKKTLAFSYSTTRQNWEDITLKLQQLEEENNRIFIEAYGLQEEISYKVLLSQITLICNPHFRYPDDRRKEYTKERRASLQLTDTMKEFISYSVGCMFGRYSLDKPGLVLANQGESLQDYLRQVPDPTFLPDEDNVIPVIGGDWFQDDITERFKKFLKVTFGEEHYSENLQFIEEAIGRDIESYFLKDFYDNHIKMYKKRPIYWMFSSPKGTFNALIYMHRYNKDTVSILLNDYLKQFRVKLESRKSYAEKLSISASGSQRERTIALKELETLKKQLEEVTTYENKVIFPLATKQIEIDLDDGVKANYPKFGEALVPIKGL